MTKFKIDLFDTALADLEDIKAYYIEEETIAVAMRVLDSIRERIDGLATMPRMCQLYRDDERFRCLVVDRYLVFYDINEKAKTVEIHHVWHAMRNIKALLRNGEAQ